MIPKSPSSFITFSFFFFLCFVTSIFADGKPYRFHEPLSKASFGLKTEKFSHFRFYWHDIVSGRNPTAMKVSGTLTNTSTSGFGLIYMIDDPLTEGPTMKSKLFGRAQGFYAFASQQGINLLMAMNFAFVEGKYNGSTITILGRNSVLSTLREMPVIGGSGLFRFARGYALVSTHKFSATTMDAIVEYNVFVMHY